MHYTQLKNPSQTNGGLPVLFGLTCLTLMGSLWLSWARHQNAIGAQSNAELQQRISKLQGDNTLLEARIAKVHNPRFLLQHLPEGLRPTRNEQVIFVDKTNKIKIASQSGGEISR